MCVKNWETEYVMQCPKLQYVMMTLAINSCAKNTNVVRLKKVH